MASSTSQKSKFSPPLTAYNLYFRYERARLLSAGKASENCPSAKVTPSELREFMAKNPHQSPASRKKRSHVKTHGAISFTELSRAVSKSWRDLDEESKQPFQEVAYDLKVEYYRKLEEERRRAKQNEATESKYDASSEATPLCSEQGSMPPPPPRKMTRLVSKEQQQGSTHGQSIQLKRAATVKSTNPSTHTQGLGPRRAVSICVTPPTKKPRVEKERRASYPESSVISSSKWPLETLPIAPIGGTSPDRTPLKDETFEPVAFRHSNTHKVSPVLERDFAEVWLMDTFEEGIPKPTHDKEHEARSEQLGFQELDAPSPPIPEWPQDKIPFSVDEMDQFIARLMA